MLWSSESPPAQPPSFRLMEVLLSDDTNRAPCSPIFCDWEEKTVRKCSPNASAQTWLACFHSSVSVHKESRGHAYSQGSRNHPCIWRQRRTGYCESQPHRPCHTMYTELKWGRVEVHLLGTDGQGWKPDTIVYWLYDHGGRYSSSPHLSLLVCKTRW